jgi:hypothetical protein
MPRLKISDDDFDLLTEEERIGLKEHLAELDAETEAEDAEIAAAVKGDPEAEAKEPVAVAAPEPKEQPAEPEPEPEPEPEEEEAEEPGEEEAAEDEPAEAAEDDTEDEPTAAAAEPEPAPEPAQPQAVRPALQLTPTEEKRLAAIPKQMREIAQKFDEGELTAVEMRDQQEVLQDELDGLKEKRVLAKVSRDNVERTWFDVTIPLFLSKHTEYVAGSARHKLLNALVIEAQMATNNPTDPKILADAHAKIIAELGEVNGAKPVKKTSKPQRELPPNFKDIPASDQTVVTQPNKFARLDKLKGADYERALSKLTPADREAYLQGA